MPRFVDRLAPVEVRVIHLWGGALASQSCGVAARILRHLPIEGRGVLPPRRGAGARGAAEDVGRHDRSAIQVIGKGRMPS
jgi:hypothetical protein